MERHVRVTTSLRAPVERAREALLVDRGAVVADHPTMAEREASRYETALAVDMGEGAAVRQAVAVELGIPHIDAQQVTLPISWEAKGRSGLFPTFAGHLVVEPGAAGSQLVLAGSYEIPLGPLGRFGDALIGRRMAQRSLSAFVRMVADRIDGVADVRVPASGWGPPRPVSLREGHRISTNVDESPIDR